MASFKQHGKSVLWPLIYILHRCEFLILFCQNSVIADLQCIHILTLLSLWTHGDCIILCIFRVNKTIKPLGKKRKYFVSQTNQKTFGLFLEVKSLIILEDFYFFYPSELQRRYKVEKGGFERVIYRLQHLNVNY